MPFEAKNTKLPRAFSKDRPVGGTSTIRPRDYTAKVIAYDTANGTVIAERLGDKQILEISIDPVKVAKQRQKDATKDAAKATAKEAGSWNGSYIDDAMAAKVPPGSLIEVERGTFQKKMKVGGEERFIIQANWIHHVPDDNEDKLLRGPITMSSYQSRATQSQFWPPHIKPIPADEANNGALQALADQFDSNFESYDKEAFRPRHGVQFRTYLPLDKTREVYDSTTGKKEPRKVVQALDASFCYDWNYKEATADSEVVSVPLTGTDLLDRLNDYLDYVDAKHPDLKGKLVTEVLQFHSYMNSKTDNSFDVSPTSYNFVARKLCTTPLKLAVGENEDYFTGRNYAVNGALMLVKDKVGKHPTTNKPIIEEQFMAARIFTNGFYAPLLSMIPTADGALVELHPDLAEVIQARNENAQRSAPASSEPAERFESALVASDVDDPFNTDGGADHYAAAFNTDASAPAPAPAPAPAAETPAAPAEPAGRPGLRGRRLGGSGS